MEGKIWHRFGLVAAAGIIWLAFFGFLGKQSTDSIARAVSSSFYAWFEPAERLASSPSAAEPTPALHFSALGEHPRQAFDLSQLAGTSHYDQFQRLLDRFVVRQGVDDNFTVRIYDDRTGETLEVFELDSTRAVYERTDSTNWTAVDRERRRITEMLMDKYETAGVPRDDLSVRWGRANQIGEAFERNEPFLAYEVRLARWLDLSLLTTQIGTVETFNQPRLVSPAGARSQYQIMPYMLRRFGIHQYELETDSGTEVGVREEYHPLLTMEPALLLVRAYSNAVGHEIPGMSAYHSGPGNIFNMFRHFLIEHDPSSLEDMQTVLEAYLWGLTDGFSVVSDHTSFGYYSRSYITSAFGSLEAVANRVVDTTRTITAEQVQLRPGKQIMLRDLLAALKEDSSASDNAYTLVQPYEEFRRLNPHISLPPVTDNTDLPSGANVRLVAESEGHDVQFFLPGGSASALESAGLDILDPDQTRYFDSRTYRSGIYAAERTEWDKAYSELVDRVSQFGFTHEHRQQLDTIAVHMEHLASIHPTPYRHAQARIVQIHQQMWDSRPWRRLADVVAAREGSYIVPPRPLELPHPQVPVSLGDR